MLRSLACVFITLIAIAARAQSFDCGKAKTATEAAICADKTLGGLDLALAGAVKKALAARRNERAAVLAAQRSWIAARDRSCAQASADCLAAAYRDRIAALRAQHRSGPAGRAALCETLAQRYRAALEAAGSEGLFYPKSPLETLATHAGSGVGVARPVAEMPDYSPQKLQAWMKQPPRDVSLPDPLLAKLADMTAQSVVIDQLPTAPYFAASSIQGTAACYNAVYFRVERGKAVATDAPAGWNDDGSGCGVRRSFGTIDGLPVAFEEAADYSPYMSARVTVSPWRGDHFAPACKAYFDYAPRFDPRARFNDWEESCDGPECDALRLAALELVASVQKNPLQARTNAENALDPRQREPYAALKKLAGAASGETPNSPADPSDYTDQAPLRLPFVFKDETLLASVGHETIGWRVFADWRVMLEQADKDRLKKRAVFSIGMARGALVKARIE